MSVDKPGETPAHGPKKPYHKPELRRLGALDVITQGVAGGSIADRRRGARRKRGRR